MNNEPNTKDTTIPEPLFGAYATSYSFSVGHGLHVRKRYGFHTPDFQRPLVWTVEQKIRFIESIWLELPIGVWVYHEDIKDCVQITLLDGQQRWDAIFCYVDGEFPVFGAYYKDLPQNEHFRFEQHCLFPAICIKSLSYEAQKDVYERLAYGGTPHEPKVTQ